MLLAPCLSRGDLARPRGSSTKPVLQASASASASGQRFFEVHRRRTYSRAACRGTATLLASVPPPRVLPHQKATSRDNARPGDSGSDRRAQDGKIAACVQALGRTRPRSRRARRFALTPGVAKCFSQSPCHPSSSCGYSLTSVGSKAFVFVLWSGSRCRSPHSTD